MEHFSALVGLAHGFQASLPEMCGDCWDCHWGLVDIDNISSISWWYQLHRRKFRSQTSDNVDRWKSKGGKSERREEQKKEDQKREKVRRQKMQVREKVEKSRNTVFFQWFVAAEGRKVGSLKRRVRSHVVRWGMKSCTPLWREAHFQVKMYKSTSASDHFKKLRCRKSARRCGAKHVCKRKS